MKRYQLRLHTEPMNDDSRIFTDPFEDAERSLGVWDIVERCFVDPKQVDLNEEYNMNVEAKTEDDITSAINSHNASVGDVISTQGCTLEGAFYVSGVSECRLDRFNRLWRVDGDKLTMVADFSGAFGPIADEDDGQ